MKQPVKARFRLFIPLTLSLLFWHSAYSQNEKDTSFYPLALGNQWTYLSIDDSSVVTETVADTQRVKGRLYYGITVNSSSPRFWLRKDSDKVFIAPTLTIQSDTTDIKENMIYNFSAAANEQWSVHLSFTLYNNCDYNGTIMLISKKASVTTSLGLYTNCIKFMHGPPCSDAGRSMEWFARGVGRVSYYQSAIWGENRFGLTKSNLPTSISDQNHLQSLIEYHLSQNFPNPFNPTTNISFQLQERSYVFVDIFDVLGRKIETLVHSYFDRGYHSVLWDASGQSSGLYFCRIQAKDFNQTIRLVLVQ
jgi:hypothetical protein